MTDLFSLEQETEATLITKALGKDGFAFAITDTRETLLWNYLELVRGQLPLDDQALLDDPVIEVLYLLGREQLEEILQEKGIYLPEETSRILLLVVINYINNDCERSFRYFASNAASGAVASFLSWEGMTYATARDLFRWYQGERTEEILLVLETYGLERVLDQILPNDVLKNIFDWSLLEERIALRRTCRALVTYQAAVHPMFSGSFHSLFEPMALKLMRNLGVDAYFLSELRNGRLDTLAQRMCRFHLLVKLLIADQDPRAETLLPDFVKEYINFQRSKYRGASDKKRDLAKYGMSQLEDILRRSEGLKSTPTLVRCLRLLQIE